MALIVDAAINNKRNNAMSNMSINGQRLWDSLMEMAKIG
ncbi:MAG: hypothetical protein ACI9RI_000780, partial [Oceanospirillaceae bacterium]